MTVEVTGLQQLLADLETRFGASAVTRISDQALIDASGVFKSALVSNMSSFKDTGATLEEITLSAPQDVSGVRQITVHWKGPKGRYRVIHLNEFGTVNNPNPRGKGAIERALRSSERAYQQAIEDSVRRAL